MLEKMFLDFHLLKYIYTYITQIKICLKKRIKNDIYFKIKHDYFFF